MLEKKEKYYTEMSNTITTFNEKNDAPLFNANIREAIVIFMMEDEEESITDANTVTADAFSHTSSSQRENVDAVFTIEKLYKSENLVNTINDLTINDAGYELNKAIASDSQGDLTRKQTQLPKIATSLTQLLTLAMRYWTKKYLDARPSEKFLSIPLWRTQFYWRHRR